MPSRLFPALPHRLAFMVIMAVLLACGTAGKDAHARNVRVRGNMDSLISFELSKTVIDTDAASTFHLSFVVPKSYSSPTFSQVVHDFNLQFTPQPDKQTTYTDNRGNEIVEGQWNTPPSAVTAQVRFKAANTTKLGTLRSTAPFPVVNIPREAVEYLFGSEQVQTDDPRIRDLARELTTGAQTQYDAVQRICEWIVDNVRYVNPPQRFDALFSLDTGTGNCQNFSHLAAALMRTVGIPVRVVNGITLDEPYDIALSGDVMRTRMGLGRHSWIEVWFPDLGWTPYNPQSTAMFIANRFIRIEVGLDNRETVNDSKVKWITRRGSTRRPNVQEVFASEFGSDSVSLTGKEYADGPLKRLMLPVVEAGTPVAAIPDSEPPAQEGRKTGQKARRHAGKTTEPDATYPAKPPRSKPRTTTGKAGKTQLKKGVAVALGNMDFPQNIDFSTYSDAPETLNGVMTLNRNFMVETAEYATTRLRQYAQVFTLPRALSLKDISLALHRYGGGGSLWIDLMEDDAGKPGELVATSEIIPVSGISMRPGYRWITFPFRLHTASLGQNTLTLKSGNYWIGLGYTGDPVINWFFTYGKPVGPEGGTRFRDALLSDWGGALSYEFNYRVRGVVR